MASRPILPAEPTTKYPPPIQPNAHPYAIKTTSSALLSRSTSSPYSANHTRHHYFPPPPSRIPIGTVVRHYHSSSLSSVEGELCDVKGAHTMPAPLPTPPSVVVSSQDNPKNANQPELTHRVRRAETMPSNATEPITENHSYDQKHEFSHVQDCTLELYVGLPPNPKQWNTDELITYLKTSFKFGSTANGDKEDSSLVDILECVRTRGLTGRELLRLTNADLAGAPLSDVQRTQLLEHSRTLRADILRGRIYVDSYHSHEVSDNSNDIYSRFPRYSASFHSIPGASASADDLHFLLDNNTGKYDNTLPPSPAMSLHRSNSVSDASTQRYRDLARMRMRRRGKVKGLVETWERASTSGSECSASEEGSVSGGEAESESEIDREFESISDAKRSPESLSNSLSALHDEPHHHIRSSAVDPVFVPQKPSLSTPPPPYSHMHTTLGVDRDQEEEPTIEELLTSSSGIPLRGARAWEADFSLGETVKRIPVALSADADNASRSLMEPDTSCHPQDDGQQAKGDSVRSTGPRTHRSTGSRRKNVNSHSRKRVVTAIFTGSPPDGVSEDSGGQDCHASALGGVVRGGTRASSDPRNDPDSALRALEESIAATRAQLEAFRLRLEEVEVNTARQEDILTEAQLSDAHHSSNFERQSETNGQATTETAETREDETLTARNRNVLESMSLADITRAIVARAIGWLFPYGHLGVLVPDVHDESQTRTGSCPGANDRNRSPAKRGGRLPLARLSCSIILVSFAICAAVLRRIGLGRWVRRP